MVKLEVIERRNRAVAEQNVAHTQGLVVVFAGATSNLGLGTLTQLATMLHGSTFYILGRSKARFVDQLDKLASLNPELHLVFIETDVSLISGIDLASRRIIEVEKKVDYLFMSQGCIPLTVPRYTSEGLDTSFALSYYSRVRLINNLLPLLGQSSRPQVLSVLNGGREKIIRENDLGLEDARHYAPRAVINHTTLMTTLVLELLAENNKHITFMHSFPGLVATDNFSRLTAPASYGFLSRLILLLVSRFISTLQQLFGISAADCGARQAFLLSSDKYGPGEAWRIDQHSEPVTTVGILRVYRDGGWREKVWDHTMSKFNKIAASNP